MEDFKIEIRYLWSFVASSQGFYEMYEGCFLQVRCSKKNVSVDQKYQASICFNTRGCAFETLTQAFVTLGQTFEKLGRTFESLKEN